MRIIGLDYGDKTVGVAVSDELFLTAQPLKTIFRERTTKLRKTLAEIESIIQEYECQKIVVGLPVGLDGQEGEMCARVREFGSALERRTGLPVVYVDERLTTKEAAGVLREGEIKAGDRKKYIDKIAASLILKTYLEEKAAGKA